MTDTVADADADVVVVIPAYRAARTLGAALASVAAQTVPPAEVVVVDDCSDDDTMDVARAWSTVLPLTAIRAERNAGPAAARRAAIAASASPLVAPLDSDDYWLPDHLESLVAVWQRSGGIVSGDGYRWRPGVGVARRTHRQILPIPDPGEQLARVIAANFVFIGCLFERADYDAVGGFRDGVSGAEDWDLWIRMIRRGAVVHATAAPTVMYRVSPSSLSLGSGIFDTYLRVLEYARQDADDPDELRVVERAAAAYEARRELAVAYATARSGDGRSARGIARRALRGSPRVRAEAAGVLLSPSAAVRATDALRRRYR
jgi:glycosyltransferase involved in cell wall biosynthesis